MATIKIITQGCRRAVVRSSRRAPDARHGASRRSSTIPAARSISAAAARRAWRSAMPRRPPQGRRRALPGTCVRTARATFYYSSLSLHYSPHPTTPLTLTHTRRCQKEGQINTCHEVACEPCAVCAEEVALRATGPISAELAEAATIAAARDVASPAMSYDDADGAPHAEVGCEVWCTRASCNDGRCVHCGVCEEGDAPASKTVVATKAAADPKAVEMKKCEGWCSEYTCGLADDCGGCDACVPPPSPPLPPPPPPPPLPDPNCPHWYASPHV